MKLNPYLIDSSKKIKDAMHKISQNKKGIIYIINKKKIIVGSVSDGDIRRYLLKGGTIKENIQKCSNPNFKFVLDEKDTDRILKLLDQKFDVIPVLDNRKRVIKFIERKDINLFNKNIIVRSRSPARISFVGGGTDVTKYFFEKSGASISFTINKFCNVHLIKRDDEKIIINSNDYNKKIILKKNEDIKYDGNLDLIKSCIKLLKPSFGFDIFVETDVKPGSGLGGSAAVSSAVIGAINYLQPYKLNKYQIAELAFQVERIELGVTGGWQDQYSTVFGGCNFMEYSENKNLVQNLILPNNLFDELERRIILCDTNMPHKGSAMQIKLSKNEKIDDYGKKSKILFNKIKEDLLRGKVNNIGKLIQFSWDLKKKLDKSMVNKKILELEKKLCNKSLADGCRLLGTGGGGYMLFYIQPRNWFNFIKKIHSMNLSYYPIKFDTKGLNVWETEI